MTGAHMYQIRQNIAFSILLSIFTEIVSIGSASGEPLPSTMAQSEPIEHGFVLIDGVDVSPPFVIQWNNEKIQINGHQTIINGTGRQGGSRKQGQGSGRSGGQSDGRPGRRNRTERQVEQLETELSSDALLLVWDDRTTQTVYATAALDVLEMHVSPCVHTRAFCGTIDTGTMKVRRNKQTGDLPKQGARQ